MRVAVNNNSHSHHHQKAGDGGGKGKDHCFADMLAGMSAHRHCKPEPPKCGHGNNGVHVQQHRDSAHSHLHFVNPHKHHGTEIKMGRLTLVRDGRSPVLCGSECLEKYEEADKPELVVSKPFEPPAPKYPKSIWDIPPSEIETEIRNANWVCSNIDTEGLTKGEIYNRIESIYKDYLGEDFETQWNLWSCAMNGGGPGSQGHGFYLAQTNFDSALIKFGVGRGNTDVIREARGYDGMSENEMRAAVREKYPKNMTLKDCILMGQEMWQLGLTDGNTGYCVQNYLKTSLGVNWNPPIYGPMSESDRNTFNSAFKKLYSAMLDMPADFDAIEALSKEYNKNGFTFRESESIDNLLDKMLACFGGGDLHTQDILSMLLEILAEMEEKGGLSFADTDSYLSQKQVDYLMGKYDIYNLSREDEKALLDELERMGIISKDENTKVYARLSLVPPEWMQGGIKDATQYWTASGEGNSISSDTSYFAHYTATTREMTLYDYLQAIISDENKLYDEGKEKYGLDAVAYMTDLMQTHQKLFDVLEEIKTAVPPRS